MVVNWIERVTGLPWREWAPTIISGVFTIIVGIVAAWAKLTSERKNRQAAVEQQQREDEVRQEEALSNDMTERFKSLMQGYEHLFQDLNTSLMNAQKRITDLEQENDTQRRTCLACPLREIEDGGPTQPAA